ncbi:MAG: TlpA disulfide reductase family protein [Myxococcota bacterium]|nr:TlpA family protein disulfide reductase [bacterium]MDP6074863.1 TlpA disulfide reductase family protein [Myxococcota bacterium]MDP7075228.1 TlpA disulfide reductase family protein [Myxococcota bacterium]MDP7300910.1 TlpA disulfide reductase family protein [Myxococcota bacterium]MDP7431210.1 TlpA disulfide reductase family protein [Myxococcota bacterium]
MRARWTLALLLLAAACGDPQPEPRAEQAARVPAPDFTLPDLGGDPVQLSSLRGKTVLLDFWATWCPPCVYQVPELNELWAAHAGADDLVILGISVDIDGVEVVEPWVREYGVEYTIVMGDEALAREFGALGFPSLVAISPDGFIDSIHAGVIEYDELEEVVTEAAGPPPPESAQASEPTRRNPSREARAWRGPMTRGIELAAATSGR